MSGSVRFCCATMDNLVDSKGNRMHLNNDSLEKAWNSKSIREARVKMMRNEPVPECKKCVLQEARGYQSMRSLGGATNNFDNTNEDGYVQTMPRSMELHLGNVCNLKCKMCGQQYSNQIGKEILEIGESDKDFLQWVQRESGNVNIWTNNLSVEYRWFQNQKTKMRLFDYIAKNITELVVIGGEPTVIPEFWEMFEYLDTRDKLKDLTITLTTNLTNVNPKLTNWLGKLKKWIIWASVDGIGPRTEYIRYPSNWDKVNENLKFYKSNIASNGSITLSPAIQLLNIDQLDDILLWWLDFCDGRVDDVFNVSWAAQVSYPTICNYDIAPKQYKQFVADKLQKSSHKFADFFWINKFYQSQISNLRNDVCEFSNREHFQKAFIRYNDTQDRHRGKTTWRELLPELEKSLTGSDT